MQKDILNKIQRRAEDSKSDALYITQGDQVLCDWISEPDLPLIEIMSIGKSIVALMIGILVDTGKIKDIDVPVCEFFPEWRQGQKEKITIRMLMDHTSGLQTIPEGNEITQAPDCVKLALCAELSHTPGTHFFYNNKAVNILSAIVQLVSSQPLDDLVKEKIFDPLGIQEFGWKRDASGNPYSLGGVQMHAKDVHKIGRLILNRGLWHHQTIVSESWLDLMLTPSPESNYICGLLWWVYKNPDIIAAQGYLGQWLYIFPKQKIIAIRQLRKGKTDLNQVDDFKDFKELLSRLAAI
ncbi:MAG: serine hydrolase domain-containing protein [Janthinobacterium lividum]